MVHHHLHGPPPPRSTTSNFTYIFWAVASIQQYNDETVTKNWFLVLKTVNYYTYKGYVLKTVNIYTYKGYVLNTLNIYTYKGYVLNTVNIYTYKDYEGYLLGTCMCIYVATVTKDCMLKTVDILYLKTVNILYLQRLWKTSAVESSEVLQQNEEAVRISNTVQY